MTDNLKEYPYPIGPFAESFPPLSPAQHAALVVRIAQHSFRPAVIVWREEIIFGVALLKAYKEAGVEPRFEQLANDADPTEALAAAAIPFLEMDNNARGRAAWMASEWSTRGRPRDEDQYSANLQNKTRAAMAERFGVSVRLINYFAQVLSENSKAVPALQQAVREWKIKGTDAARVISRPAVVQERAVELVMSKEVRTVSRAVERVEREMAEAVEAAALADMLAQPLDETMTLHVAQIADILRLVPANTVDAIITHPPQAEDKLFMYSDLAALAAHALKPSGFMAVLGNGMFLPRMLAHLEHEGIRWIMEQDVLSQGAAGSFRAPVLPGPPPQAPARLRQARLPARRCGRPDHSSPAGGVARRPRPERDHHGLDHQEVVPVRTDGLRPDDAGSGRHGAGGEEAGLHLHRRHGASVLSGPHPEADDGSRSRLRWTIRNRFTQRRRNERVAAHANPVGDTGSSFRRR